MTLMKWRTPSTLPGIFSNVFDNAFKDDWMNTDWALSNPSVNILNHPDRFELQLAAPGLKKEDFGISLDNNILTISVEKESETTETKENYTRREFNYSSFKRSFTLPDTVEKGNIKAGYENGILVVTMPKKEEAKLETSRKIQIS